MDAPAASALPRLPLARYCLRLKPLGEVRLPRYAGSAWRGAFGRALRNTVCVTRLPSCADCLLLSSCAYPYIFETLPPPDAAKMRRYAAVPHPFVLDLPAAPDGEIYSLGLTLFGRSDRHFPYVLHAMLVAAERGIGSARTRFSLERVDQQQGDEWAPIYRPGEPLTAQPARMPEPTPMPPRARLVLETPLRLRRGEHYVRPEDFRFADLVRRAAGVSPEAADLRWHDWTRYSSRQRTTMEMGGLLGAVDLDLTSMEPFWPYFWLGQWTHAGKGTTMGLGKYRIEAAGIADQR